MKTSIFIIILLFITTMCFSQTNTKNISNTQATSKAVYVKLDDVKGEANDNSTKRTIKIGGTEKPYARTKADSRKNSNRWWVNKKMKESDLTKSNNQRTKGETTLGDIDIMKNKKTRRRVLVAKSNKQGDPNSN